MDDQIGGRETEIVAAADRGCRRGTTTPMTPAATQQRRGPRRTSRSILSAHVTLPRLRSHVPGAARKRHRHGRRGRHRGGGASDDPPSALAHVHLESARRRTYLGESSSLVQSPRERSHVIAHEDARDDLMLLKVEALRLRIGASRRPADPEISGRWSRRPTPGDEDATSNAATSSRCGMGRITGRYRQGTNFTIATHCRAERAIQNTRGKTRGAAVKVMTVLEPASLLLCISLSDAGMAPESAILTAVTQTGQHR
jgi:hypothetical protein